MKEKNWRLSNHRVREQKKKKGINKNYKNKLKMVNKVAINTYLSIINYFKYKWDKYVS